ncbi:MAG: hypothetical protein ABL886_06285 [Rhodoglobus sp.]
MTRPHGRSEDLPSLDRITFRDRNRRKVQVVHLALDGRVKDQEAPAHEKWIRRIHGYDDPIADRDDLAIFVDREIGALMHRHVGIVVGYRVDSLPEPQENRRWHGWAGRTRTANDDKPDRER